MSVEKTVLITSISLIAVFLIVIAGVIWAYWPKYEEQFIELGLLGKNKLAEDFFPNANSMVPVNAQIDWYIYLHNHMDNTQNVILKVKLLNSAMELPNDLKHEPSPYASFVEFPLVLSNNETLIFPFSWSITELNHPSASVVLEQLKVNNETIDVNVAAASTSYFQMVFELWVYDSSSGEYLFGWTTRDGLSSASVYIGFRTD